MIYTVIDADVEVEGGREKPALLLTIWWSEGVVSKHRLPITTKPERIEEIQMGLFHRTVKSLVDEQAVIRVSDLNVVEAMTKIAKQMVGRQARIRFTPRGTPLVYPPTLSEYEMDGGTEDV